MTAKAISNQAEILEALGMHAESAAAAREALQVFEAQVAPITRGRRTH